MTIQEETDHLKQKIELYEQEREYTLSGNFFSDILSTKVPTLSQEDLHSIRVAMQEQLRRLQIEEDNIAILQEEIKSKVAKQAEKASKEGTDYPSFSEWKTSIRRTYSYNEDIIKAKAEELDVPESSLYKVTTKFDPSKVLKSKNVPEELKTAILENKLVSKCTASVKWAYES